MHTKHKQQRRGGLGSGQEGWSIGEREMQHKIVELGLVVNCDLIC